MVKAKKEDVKAVWEIAEKLMQESNPFDYHHADNNDGIVVGGGRGEDPKTTWEEAYEILLKKIC